jgi:hypothetical protein
MKFPFLQKNISPIEIVLAIIFVIYLALPIETPSNLGPIIDSPVGYLVMFCFTIYLFLHAHPVLGVLSVFVAYELIRRSSVFTGTNSYMQYTPNQTVKDKELHDMNPPQDRTLEEDVVEKMAPISGTPSTAFIDTGFKPTSEAVHGASLL